MRIKLISVCLFGFIALSIKAQSVQFIGEKKLYYGVSYYPEAWNLQGINEDIRRMKELHINVVRMAEFSWAWMEPVEGVYKFDWLKQVMDKLHENGIAVILGTPTATPPVWMATKYPAIFQVDEDGFRLGHGGRRNGSYTSKKYRLLSKLICEKMAQYLGRHPALIGWQTDNEFSLSPDFSNETKEVWQAWLQKKFGTIQQLNKQWCTQLWSQQYNSFQQVPMPVKKIWHHPSLLFNWTAFNNDMMVEFQDIQLKAIRQYSRQPITHDGMPGQAVDYEKLFTHLDFMAVNNYHSFEAYDLIQSNYDRMRGYGKGYHWLFETAPNYSGGGSNGNTWFLHQPDGSLNAAIWMNYALGGQGAMYWLWRQHPAGQEMTHGSVISAWNKPAANYNDIQKLGTELQQASDFLMQAPVEKPKAAIVWCHQNLAGLSFEQYANGLNYYQDWTYRFYIPMANAYIHRDVISQTADISSYQLLFIPLAPYISDNLRQRLRLWVENGGVLILGPMSGYRNKEWASFTEHAMGDIETWSGITVESRIPIGTIPRPAEIPIPLQFNADAGLDSAPAQLWSEALSTSAGNTIATYQMGMHRGKPAIIENNVGKGKVVILGTDPGKKAMQYLLLHFALEAGIHPIATGEAGVVVAPRNGKNQSGFVVVNITNEKKFIYLPQGNYINEFSKKLEPFQLQLKPYEVKVLVEEKK